jgi:hypothetical protein
VLDVLARHKLQISNYLQCLVDYPRCTLNTCKSHLPSPLRLGRIATILLRSRQVRKLHRINEH